MEDVIIIEAGTYHNLAMTSNGEILTWGHCGKYGRLGLDSETTITFRFQTRHDESVPTLLHLGHENSNSNPAPFILAPPLPISLTNMSSDQNHLTTRVGAQFL